MNAACSVSADSIDQTVTLSQVRTSKLTAAGMVANQKEDFSIKLEDCDTTVSQNAAVILMVSRTVHLPARWRIPLARVRRQMLRCSCTADGRVLNIGDTSGAITLINGENTVPLSVDYVATGAATAGNVAATATFSMVYS